MWAAIYRADRNETEVGLYDLEQFAFSPVLTVPGLEFSSYEMWVDEASRKIYITYRGQLLQADLASPVS